MQKIADRLEDIVGRYSQKLEAIPEHKMAFRPSPGKWSKKEIIGHLVDSAHSNIRRFVVAQYEDHPFIVYNQDKWVQIAGYQQWDSNRIISLWAQLNLQACFILRNTSAENAKRLCMTQELHSLEWLAEDYIKHLLHHLHQVLESEPVPYP